MKSSRLTSQVRKVFERPMVTEQQSKNCAFEEKEDEKSHPTESYLLHLTLEDLNGLMVFVSATNA